MSVRAKFSVSFVDQQHKTVYLAPVYSGSDENKAFFAATPGGQISLNTVNDAALSQFENGKEFYIDFTPADDDANGKRSAVRS